MWGFQSCDDESYDVVGNPDNLIFVKTNYSFDVSRSPMGGVESVKGDEVLVQIPVYATRPVDSEVTVSADFDASLVEKYNATNSVEYTAIDESLITWTRKTVKFAQGSYSASDVIEFSVSKENCAKLLEGSYVIPIRLTDSSSATISLNNRYSYTVINCDYIYIDSEATEMVGTVLTDKSYWEISSDDASADLSNCIDGENSTSTSFSKSPTITIENAYSMVLLGALEARYLKFNMEWNYGSWAGRKLGEINVYVTE